MINPMAVLITASLTTLHDSASSDSREYLLATTLVLPADVIVFISVIDTVVAPVFHRTALLGGAAKQAAYQ